MVFVNKYRHNSICGICKQGQTCKIWGICKQVQIWLDLKTSKDLFGHGAFDRNLRNKMVTSVDFVDLLRINGY